MLHPIIRKDRIDKAGQTKVFIRYTYNRKFILFDTMVKSKVKDFNTKSGKVKSKDFNHTKKNLLITKKLYQIENIVLELQLDGKEPTLYNVNRSYDKLPIDSNKSFMRSKTPIITDIDTKVKYDFFTEYEKMIDEKLKLNEYTKKTSYKHNTTIRRLMEYSTKYNIDIDFNMINKDFINQFNIYLYDELDLTDNAIDQYIKTLKTFMRYTKEKHLHGNTDYEFIKRKRRQGDIITLSSGEIERILSYEPSKKYLKKTKDIIILGISTGLRFSDLTKLTNTNFYIKRNVLKNNSIDNEKSYVELTLSKTGTTKHKIPFNNNISYIVEKYDIENSPLIFNNITNQVFNRFLKELCKEVKIDEIVRISKFQGNKEIVIEKPKYDIVSSHILRKSYITYLIENNYSTELVMQLSGHKSYDSFKRYVSVSMNEKTKTVKSFDNLLEKSLITNTLKELKELSKTDKYSKIKRDNLVKNLSEIYKNKYLTEELIREVKENNNLTKKVKSVLKKITTEEYFEKREDVNISDILE